MTTEEADEFEAYGLHLVLDQVAPIAQSPAEADRRHHLGDVVTLPRILRPLKLVVVRR